MNNVKSIHVLLLIIIVALAANLALNLTITGYAGIETGKYTSAERVPEQAWQAASEQAIFKRVLVTPFSPDAAAQIRTLVDVRHEFDGKFSANIPADLLPKISTMADVEDIIIYEILARPKCGDGSIHPREDCGEPGLSDCPEGQVCQNCKCVTPEEEEGRTCYPTTQLPWGVVKVNGGTGGAGVTVAVLDTGVHTGHPDLDVKLCKDATKRGIKGGCSDKNGHGTHVAGTVAANSGSDGQGIFGVAPTAILWAIKVCGASGTCWADDIAAGIRYAADQGADIISMSFGADTQSSLIKNAIDYAVSQGVLVVAAAGNDGPALGSIDYPGANQQVLAVGAIDSAEAVPDWSSRGVNDGDYNIEEREVEFGAPGVTVESTWNNGCYKAISGTSMSAPHVAGLAAKLWQGSAADTRTYLQDLAKTHDISPAGDDPATGFGLPIAP